MGCDMHTILQFKGKTVAMNFHGGRDYELFGILANVRGGLNEPPGESVDVFPVSIGDVELQKTQDRDQLEDVEAVFNDTDKKAWMGTHSHRTMTLGELASTELRLTDAIVLLHFVELIKETLVNKLDEEEVEELMEQEELEEFIGDNYDSVTLIVGFDS